MNDKVKYGSNLLDYKKIEDEFATHLSKWLEWEDIAPDRLQNIRKVASSFLKSWKENGNFDPIAQTYTGNIEGNSEDIAEVLRFVNEAISGRGLDYFKYKEPEKPKEEEKSIALILLEQQLKLLEKTINSLEFNESLYDLGKEIKDLNDKYKDSNPELYKLEKQEESKKLLSKVKEESEKIEKHFSNNIKLSEFEKYDFTESDKKRLLSLFLDVVSIVDPEPISATGLGLSSDYLTWLADKLDGINNSIVDDLTNVGLSLFGAIPVAGDLGMIGKITKKIPKSLKTLTRLTSIPSVVIALDLSEELTNTWNKLLEGGKNLTVEDARNMYTILTLALGIGRAGKSMHTRKKATDYLNQHGTDVVRIKGLKKGKNTHLDFKGSDADFIRSGDTKQIQEKLKKFKFTPKTTTSLNWKDRKHWYSLPTIKTEIPFEEIKVLKGSKPKNLSWSLWLYLKSLGNVLLTKKKPSKKKSSNNTPKSIEEAMSDVLVNNKSLNPLFGTVIIKGNKLGGILKAQTGTPLWFSNRYKSKSLKGWNPELNKNAWISGGIRGNAANLDLVYTTNNAYGSDIIALLNDLSNYYSNSVLDEEKALELYNLDVNKLNNFWYNADNLTYKQNIDFVPTFSKLYISRHSNNPNYGLGYQNNLSTSLGSTTWLRRALAYENDLNKAFDFGARKVAFNKDGTIRFVDNIQSIPEVLNSETLNVETHSYSDKNKDEKIPELQKAPKNRIYIGEILAKSGLYVNSYNKKILDTLNKTPLYQMILPPNISKKIYGNLRAIEEAQKAKGELKSEASKARTSDANLEAARLFLADYQGNQYLAQEFKEDDAIRRKTEAERQLQDEKNAMSAWQTVNQNLKYLNDLLQGKIKAKVDYLASQRESRDNLLKALERIYMTNKYDKYSKQEAAYNEYIKNYALRYPSATGLKEADIDILRKTTRTDQEERYYLEYILPTLQSWILSQKYGNMYYPNLPINKPGYYKVY